MRKLFSVLVLGSGVGIASQSMVAMSGCTPAPATDTGDLAMPDLAQATVPHDMAMAPAVDQARVVEDLAMALPPSDGPSFW